MLLISGEKKQLSKQLCSYAVSAPKSHPFRLGEKIYSLIETKVKIQWTSGFRGFNIMRKAGIFQFSYLSITFL